MGSHALVLEGNKNMPLKMDAEFLEVMKMREAVVVGLMGAKQFVSPPHRCTISACKLCVSTMCACVQKVDCLLCLPCCLTLHVHGSRTGAGFLAGHCLSLPAACEHLP